MRMLIIGGLALLLAVAAPGAPPVRGGGKAKGGRGEGKPLLYPDAKRFEEDRQGPGIYHGKYTTPDKPEKVRGWYREKAGLVGGEGIGFARRLEEGEASSVLDDSRKPGKTERHRGEARDVKVIVLT